MDKICVVTGGTGGIGRAAVRMMSERCHVLFCDVNQEKIDAFIQELAAEGIKADGMTCDVSDRAQCDRLAQTAASSTGWTKLGIVASRQMQARLAPDVEIQDADYSLSNALYLLN